MKNIAASGVELASSRKMESPCAAGYVTVWNTKNCLFWKKVKENPVSYFFGNLSEKAKLWNNLADIKLKTRGKPVFGNKIDVENFWRKLSYNF